MHQSNGLQILCEDPSGIDSPWQYFMRELNSKLYVVGYWVMMILLTVYSLKYNVI